LASQHYLANSSLAAFRIRRAALIKCTTHTHTDCLCCCAVCSKKN